LILPLTLTLILTLTLTLIVTLLLILPATIQPKKVRDTNQAKKQMNNREGGGAAAHLLNNAFHFSWRSPPVRYFCIRITNAFTSHFSLRSCA